MTRNDSDCLALTRTDSDRGDAWVRRARSGEAGPARHGGGAVTNSRGRVGGAVGSAADGPRGTNGRPVAEVGAETAAAQGEAGPPVPAAAGMEHRLLALL